MIHINDGRFSQGSRPNGSPAYQMAAFPNAHLPK